jgi:hypothetical protein
MLFRSQTSYVSPSDDIMSPCTKKLSDLKGKRFKKYDLFTGYGLYVPLMRYIVPESPRRCSPSWARRTLSSHRLLSPLLPRMPTSRWYEQTVKRNFNDTLLPLLDSSLMILLHSYFSIIRLGLLSVFFFSFVDFLCVGSLDCVWGTVNQWYWDG